jgi:hypothetical protein
MATLVAMGYPEHGTAEEARRIVGRLQGDLAIRPDTKALQDAQQPAGAQATS